LLIRTYVNDRQTIKYTMTSALAAGSYVESNPFASAADSKTMHFTLVAPAGSRLCRYAVAERFQRQDVTGTHFRKNLPVGNGEVADAVIY
jgi:hypothetical protein